MSEAQRVYFVLGELSGDALAADLMEGFEKLGTQVEPMGLAGPKLSAKGVQSVFDIDQLSVMGFTEVAQKLPSLIARVRQTVSDILARKPDVVVLIDSPEFGYAVAKRVKKRAPDIRIVKYICPSVWAWRPGRARKMASYIDHVLAILPFEPRVLKDLGGPDATYVGHPLGRMASKNDVGRREKVHDPLRLLLLPGSRRSEIKRHLTIIEQTVRLLSDRGRALEIRLLATDNLADDLRARVSQWSLPVEIKTGDVGKTDAFQWADVALATSGTVTLELALQGIPFAPIYKLDPVMSHMRHLFTGWSTSLPNLIADRVFVQECLNEFCTPDYIVRVLEGLAENGPARETQLAGFKTVANAMRQSEETGVIAARVILSQAGSAG